MSVRTAETFQTASSDDHDAATTRCPYRTLASTPCSRAVSWMYDRIEAPSAIALAWVHGRNRYPSVNMSESERMPG